MKKLIITAGLFVLGVGPTWSSDEIKLIGAGAIISNSPYEGVGTKSMAVPVLVWDYKNFYIKGVEAGYRFFQRDPLSVSVVIAPRFMGYHSSESDALSGMEDRDSSLDAGMKAELAWPWPGTTISAKVVTDVLSRSSGQEGELKLSQELRGEIWRLVPALGVRLQTAKLTDYYYGVNSDESRAGRPEYSPGATVNCFADIMLSFAISKNWVVIFRAEAESLGKDIRKSPLVENDLLFTEIIGIARRF